MFLAPSVVEGYNYYMINKNSIITIIVLVLLGVGYYLYTNKGYWPFIPTTSQEITDEGVTIGVESTGDFKLENIPIATTTTAGTQPVPLPPAPEYLRTFVYPAYFNVEARTITNKNIADQQKAIDKNKTDLNAWIELGNLYNLVQDYDGARIMWEYATKLNPDYFVPYANLGNLYMSDMRNYAKAEANFKLAIKADPNQINVYRSFYELYRFGFKDDIKAKAILEEGIKANSNKAQDLIYLRDHYSET